MLPPSQARESVLSARVLIGQAQAEGMDLAMLGLPQASIDALLNDDTTSVPLRPLTQMAEAMAQRLGDQHFCLRLQEYPTPAGFGLAGYHAAAASDAGTYLRDLFEVVNCTSNVFGLHVEFTPHRGRIILQPNFSHDAIRHLAEMDLACVLTGVQRLICPNFDPAEVRLVHSSKHGSKIYRSLFQCKVFFDQPHYELRFDPRLEHERPLTADPNLRAALAPFVFSEKHLLRQCGSTGFHVQVRAEIGRRLQGQAPSLEEIADALQLRPRTLQHRLRREGFIFRDLLDDARKQSALPALTRGIAPAEVADNLGYAELPSFYRAFRRWTGSTPAAFRLNVRR